MIASCLGWTRQQTPRSTTPFYADSETPPTAVTRDAARLRGINGDAEQNADWYRLLDLCALTGTLIGDIDGIYDPSDYSDRLSLGLKGTIAEAELHVLRARLDGGIRNKAARGELRRALPVGLVWGEADGQILLHRDEAV